MTKRWQPVLDPATYPPRYAKDFDCEKLYRFRRDGYDGVQSFRMSEAGPYFNLAGLYWRDPFA